MKISELITKFLKRKSLMQSEGTSRFYESHANSLRNYFNANGFETFDQFTEDDFYEYIECCKELGLSNKTINNRVNIIKQLIKMTPKSEWTADLISILGTSKLRVEPKSYMPLPEKSLNAFLDWVFSLNMNNKKNLKKACMFLLFVQNGIRANELLELKTDDLLMDSNRIKLTHTKCNGPRYAYFNEETKDLITRYLKLFNPKTFLFQNDNTKEKLGPQGLEDMFRVASKHVGFRVTPHILRSTFATNSLRNGCNIESVRIMMGHQNLKTTQMYLHMTDEEIFNDNQEYNPLAKYHKDKEATKSEGNE